MLTKEECEKALMNICSSNAKMKDRKVFYQLINEHFDNPPLKFEELKPKMWIWDSIRKCFLKITRVEVDEWYRHFVHHYYDINMNGTTRTLFKENRFYRKQVE